MTGILRPFPEKYWVVNCLTVSVPRSIRDVGVNFIINAVGTEAPDFFHLGLLDFNASDEFNPFGTPATRVRIPIDGSHWYVPGHAFG